MKFELEIMRFNLNDVITASADCDCDTCEEMFVGDMQNF